MIEIETSVPPHPPLATETTTAPVQNICVPKDVYHKFDVENVTESIEQLIAKKIYAEDLENEEAFYFIDLGAVLRKYKQWVQNLPRVKPYFAMKCNPNNAIIKTLASLGVNFDCASKAEIQQILGLGIAANRIIYANPTKMKSHISYAKSQGVEMMTFDNADELRKIAEVYPEGKCVMRIITDDSHSVCRFSTKFGAPMEHTQKLLELAKELNLNLVGVSFHVGSGCMSTKSFESALRSARKVFDDAAKLGMNLTLLDLGGGWPGTDGDGILFSDIAKCVREVTDELFPPEVEVIAEPGRYFVAESHTLTTNVFAKRKLDSEQGTHFLYYINDGVYQSFNCIFFDHVHPKPLVYEPKDRTELHKCTIFGPTCDSMDCIAKDVYLPELEVGEWLYFKNMGAYTVAAASPFNGFKSMPNTFYVCSPF